MEFSQISVYTREGGQEGQSQQLRNSSVGTTWRSYVYNHGVLGDSPKVLKTLADTIVQPLTIIYAKIIEID